MPRISWSIHAGTTGQPDQLLVCQSVPRTECVVGASRPDAPLFATVHLFLHPASSPTTYTGAVNVGFFASASVHRIDVYTSIKPGEDPRGPTVYDRLPTQPGTYPMEIDLIAAPASGEDLQIRDRLAVIVK